MKIKFLTIIAIIALIAGCKEEFVLSNSSYEERVVIEGFVTNSSEPYSIHVSKTSKINSTEKVPYSNCVVTILDNLGNVEDLTETEPGIYITSVGGIKGEIGNNYKLIVLTPNGDRYESEYETMLAPLEIDSIHTELDYRKKENLPYQIPGYQFFITTKESPTKENYFLWKSVETFQYSPNYRLYALYFKQKIYINGIDTITEFDNLSRCWKTQNILSVYTGKTSNLSTPKIINQPLLFVSTETKRLQERYSLNVYQYSISKEAYYYWKSIQDQSSNQNFLYTSQPYNVIGNIKNINKDSEIVFGYFTVASFTSKRIFINQPYVPFYYERCAVNIDLTNLFKKTGPIYLVYNENGELGYVPRECLDCTSEGGIITPPDFWIY